MTFTNEQAFTAQVRMGAVLPDTTRHKEKQAPAPVGNEILEVIVLLWSISLHCDKS